MCTRVERICQVDPEGWYAPVIGQELVRCKDCKHYTWHTMANCYYCAITGVVLKEDDFCSYGKRKEE